MKPGSGLKADLALVREALPPRGHHRLCRVNMPTDFSSECNCPREENERDHAALDRIERALNLGEEEMRLAAPGAYTEPIRRVR